MAGASAPQEYMPSDPDRARSTAPAAPAPSPRILVLAGQAHNVGKQILEILLTAGSYMVSLERGDAVWPDLIIPILTLEKDPVTALAQLRSELPQALMLPVVHEMHLSEALARSLSGTTDFLTWPVRGSELLARVRRLLPLRIEEEIDQVRERLHESLVLERLRGMDPAFNAVKRQILLAAKADVNVLVSGETGTGKELTAQAIHYLSNRAGKPFVPVTCGAIPVDLFENELFGHHRGAFTDARSHQSGLVAEAGGGTLFLDEVDALPASAQVKVLRFIEDRTYRPLGSPRIVKANLRIVAATNIDLWQKVQEATFRNDLYYRLRVLTLHLPPLRERVGDIAVLAEYFLQRYTKADSRLCFSPEALEALRGYAWPGNVRELENVVQQIVAMNPPRLIRLEDLPWPLRPVEVAPVATSFREAKSRAITQFEQSYLSWVLQSHHGNITRAALAARQDRRTFRRLLKKHQLNRSV